MLKRIVAWSLEYWVLVLIIFAIVVFAGWRAVSTIPIDAFPDVTPNQVNVYTESPGLAAEDVERLLSFPIESGMAGLPGVTEIRSVSLFGLSYVSVFFEDDIDIYFARRLVMERLQEVGERIPEGYGTPELGPNSSGLGQVFWYTVERLDSELEAASDMDLRTLQDWTVRLILRTAPGVDDVLSWGGQERQYQVIVDPLNLIKYRLGFREILEIIGRTNRQVGGQYVNLGAERYLVRGIGLVRDEEDIGNIVVKVEHGTPVYLRDIAEIREAPALRFGAVTRDGEEVVLGMALSRIGTNAKEVVENVKERVKVVRSALPGNAAIRPIYDRADLVERAIATATNALVQGAVLVTIVLFIFLGDLRSSIVVITALPLAMLIAFICMSEAGLSANLMSLAWLASGIGMLADGAVVIVENAFRKISEAPDGDDSRNRRAIVMAAAQEVANPITFAILIIIVVFLPLFSLEGLEGKLFKPMAFNISFAMAGSLVLSLSLIPVLAAFLLKPGRKGETRLFAVLRAAYRPLLEWAMARRRTVAGTSVALLLGSLALFPLLGKEFMPELEEGSIMWRVTSIPSTSLEQSIEVSKRIEQVLSGFPEVVTTLAMIGRAEKGETADANYMEIYTELAPQSDWASGRTIETLADEMRHEMEEAVPTAVFAFTQPIQMRVEELISGVRATLAAKLYGEDLGELDRLSAEIRDVIADVDGVAELSLEANSGKPQIRIRVKREALARYGLNADDVLDIVRNGIGAEPVSALVDGVRRFDIAVRLPDSAKSSIESIADIPLRTGSGAIIPLSVVADVERSEGYTFVRREQLQRYAVIQMDVRGRDIDGFVQEASELLAERIELPPGYWVEWGGAFENQQRALARLAIIVPLTILLIFILLYTAFDSVKYAVLIITNVPFALIGGLVSLFASGQYVSVPSAIGFVAVFGIAMQNGIVLVSFINDLRGQGMELPAAVRQGATLRLRPVLMTALTTLLGLLPLLLSTGVGAETQRPLATVVIGGLLTSTLLTLVVLPVVYEWMET